MTDPDRTKRLFAEAYDAAAAGFARSADRLVYTYLAGKGLASAMLSSDLPQKKRERVMAQFRSGQIRHLVTTDVASRGIDVDDLSHVFIFSTPDSPEQYIHRAGRTGRVGRSGRAISLISAHDLMNFNRLVKRYHVEVREMNPPSDAEVQARKVERIVTSLAAPWVTPFDPVEQDIAARLKAPGERDAAGRLHPLGTDHLGRDLLARVIYGAQPALLVGFAAVVISGLLGMAAGSPFFSGAGAPPPARPYADPSPRICSSSARGGRRRYHFMRFISSMFTVSLLR